MAQQQQQHHQTSSSAEATPVLSLSATSKNDNNNNSNSNNNNHRTPFDWLQSSIFFGGINFNTNQNSNTNTSGRNNSSNKNDFSTNDIDDSAFVERCTNISLLLNGVSENLIALTTQQSEERQEGSGIKLLDSITQQQEQQDISSNEFVSVGSVVESPSDKLACRLARIRYLLYDERRSTSQQYSTADAKKQQQIKPVIAVEAIQALSSTEDQSLHRLMVQLLENMLVLPFETRKHVSAMFNYLLVCGLEGIDAPLYTSAMNQFVAYVERNYEQFMTLIVQGHNLMKYTPDIALHFGAMYRSATRHPSLYLQLVGTSDRAQRFVYPFLDEYVNVANFEIASDAMESLRTAFAASSTATSSNSGTGNVSPNAQQQQQQHDSTDHMNRLRIAEIAAEFLHRDYDAIWDERFTPKLLSDTANYMSRRVALQILSTVLLTRSNYAIMIRYVASRSNLIVIMHLLRDTSPHITLDAFHVFKVFVANPNKPSDIIKILHDNKTKLCAYLTTLHQEKEENDTQFRDEKALIIATIDAL